MGDNEQNFKEKLENVISVVKQYSSLGLAVRALNDNFELRIVSRRNIEGMHLTFANVYNTMTIDNNDNNCVVFVSEKGEKERIYITSLVWANTNIYEVMKKKSNR